MTHNTNKKVRLDLRQVKKDAFIMITTFLLQAQREQWNFNEVQQVLQKAQLAQDEAVFVILSQYCEPPFPNLLSEQSN